MQTTNTIEYIASDFEKELTWVSEILNTRFSREENWENADELVATGAPVFENRLSPYSQLIEELHLNNEERIIFILALSPYLYPHLLDVLHQKDDLTNKIYSYVGGAAIGNYSGLLPTAETAIYIIAGTDIKKRLQVLRYFNSQHVFAIKNMVTITAVSENLPVLAGIIDVPRELKEHLFTGETSPPLFSASFPAERLTTKMEWEDLILNRITTKQLDEIETWIIHHDTMMSEWGMDKKIKPGYRAIFHGPAGTGKSLTAALLGKKTGKEVYRIDLSKVISKYIGETEKNLSNVFNEAENKNWILFFDEADALFGKRTSISNSHDRYANQEVSYLLQRIESYNGLVILASNLKTNMDEAFMRRFQSDIYFPMPKAEERKRIWESSFSSIVSFDEEVDLVKIAQDYEIAGGSILNVVQYSSLMALKRESTEILFEDVIDGIRKEFHKEGKIL